MPPGQYLYATLVVPNCSRCGAAFVVPSTTTTTPRHPSIHMGCFSAILNLFTMLEQKVNVYFDNHEILLRVMDADTACSDRGACLTQLGWRATGHSRPRRLT
ncbi:hypothetical protein Cob_v005139 [Colletotrichum orbiculare MAFF 240422]|uniref:Uncharacterized protein n=1 Tax=Colletotrichum orbiculare (strain 104-T / ATCC 96160 / CBS 514.97 / LARS 414 / MAFF 240422) TaxID=1213857 RepID=A0A484FWP8_COLOR|nr:hypothetical protein Cob_v005139 [Colletotrichum orbiculare MAFF 240422]